jgi:hypothetical protein
MDFFYTRNWLIEDSREETDRQRVKCRIGIKFANVGHDNDAVQCAVWSSMD